MNKSNFRRLLLDWYEQHKRDLPWRNSTNPYQIWLSEIILQQTRVNQGLPYYHKFIDTYPTVKELAEAPIEKVLKTWEGLGYYSRARNLHATAQYIYYELAGVFPTTHKDVLLLKGIGDYTAAAICSFAYQQAHAVVDGNVYRFLSRYLGISTAINTGAGKKEFSAIAETLLDKKQPDLHNQAIMEFGALQCSAQKPSCETCPFKNSCVALIQNKVMDYPVKNKKSYNKVRHLHFSIITYNYEVIIEQRTEKDIWHLLFQFPLLEAPTPMLAAQWQDELSSDYIDKEKDLKIYSAPPHKLSHQTIHCHFTLLILPSKSNRPSLKNHQTWCSVEQLKNFAFPKPIRAYIDSNSSTFAPHLD